MKFLVFIHLFFLYSLTGYSQVKKIETLRFKNFKVDIVNFVSECSPCSDDVHPLDTLNISENPCDGNGWYIQGRTLKIIPKLKNDRFELYFAYQVDISEVEDLPSSKQENTDKWSYMLITGK